MKKILVILGGMLLILGLFAIPYFKMIGKNTKEVSTKINTPLFQAEQTVKLEVKSDNPYLDGGYWHTPYTVVSEYGTVFSGEAISKDVVAPSGIGVENGEVVIRYKGVNLQSREIK